MLHPLHKVEVVLETLVVIEEVVSMTMTTFGIKKTAVFMRTVVAIKAMVSYGGSENGCN